MKRDERDFTLLSLRSGTGDQRERQKEQRSKIETQEKEGRDYTYIHIV